ncbi:MAG: protein kinase [Phycisphaerae bacterium]|jgi:uncharacterized RDD family membrane protein YckC
MAFTFKHGDRPLEGFTIQRAVGRGGFGEVYYAVSDGGRDVALKYLRDNPGIELRGVSHCMNLKSPHLVKIFDIIKNNEDEPFIVMEYVDGPSLRDLLIAEPTGLGPQKAAFFIRELAKGLSYLHERGIVHRDMKPGNIFYDDGYVKIGDYGLSKFIAVSQQSVQTSSVGTVHYMAPEIGSGHYHRGIDIYALGVMLYEMLIGRVPFEGSSMGEVLMKHLTSQPEVESLPDPFGHVICKALEKDPKDRYQTVDEMAEELLDVDEVQQSLAGFDAMSLTVAVRRAVPEPVVAGVGAPPPPPPGHAAPYAQPVPGGGGTGIGRAFRDLADKAGDALKAAAAGVPVGTPSGSAAPLSPEAASGRVHYAGFWVRFGAALLDLLIVGVVCDLLGFDDATAGVVILYQALLIGLWDGQTLGKRACGIKVISADGHHPTLGQSFGRAFAKLLNVLTLMIGYLMIPFDDRRRGLHDRIAGTYAVHAIA